MAEKHLPHDHGTKQIDNYEYILEHTDFQTSADVFKQLSDKTRLQIFWFLCHSEECVINISALLSMSSPAISHHLRILKANNLIVSRREGKEVYYKAADNVISQQLHIMIEKMIEISCPSPQ